MRRGVIAYEIGEGAGPSPPPTPPLFITQIIVGGIVMAETPDFQSVLAAFKARRARLDYLIAGIEWEMALQMPDVRPGPDPLETESAASLPATVAIHPDS